MELTGDDVRAWFAAVEGPGLGRVGTAADPAVTTDGARLAVTAYTRVSLDEALRSGVAVVDVATGGLTVVGTGRHDRLPRWSPDASALAWLTDAGTPDELRPAWAVVPVGAGGGPAAEPPSSAPLAGTAEDVSWSPAGGRLLVVVHAEDGPGPTSTAPAGVHPTGPRPGDGPVPPGPTPDWRPVVLRPAEPTGRRSAVLVDTATAAARPVDLGGANVWEAVWCGPEALAAVVSDSPGEESWYATRLVHARLGDPAVTELHRGGVQLGRPAATPSGRRVAVVEAFCSDRSLVAGSLVVLDTTAPDAPPLRPDSAGVDVTRCCWRTEDVLAFIGVRGLRTVAGEVDVVTGTVRETWVSDGSTSGSHPEAAWSADGTVHAVAESWAAAPHVVTVAGGTERTVLDLAHDGTRELVRRAGRIAPVSWTAPDGVVVEALLVTPAVDGDGPVPLVLDIHGGPVWAWRNQFRMGQHTTPLLAALGFAVLLPNPRGSSGRGQAYARLVERDVCGPDTDDFLSGLDHLVAAGIADPARLGVTGTSYGGTMACWLPTQDTRFAAAVPVSGGTDWVSFHFTTDIPDFDPLVLPGDALDPGGEYVRRSPLTHARTVRTPVLHLAGARDTCVPVGQAMEFHRALSLRGAVSELVVYPLEGHGVHDFPAVADAVERTVGWFCRYLTGPAAT